MRSQRIDSPHKQRTPPATEPTNQEIFKWTLTNEAIATCFVRDVLSLRGNDGQDTDFFWLGRVPCRTVRIVGLVVGIQVFEKRIVYSVDDGTSVVDCFHRQAPPPASPTKQPTATTSFKRNPLDLLEPPKPIAPVGSSVRIVGKVISKHSSRQIKVDQIELCASPNDEPEHWKNVLSLHKSLYSRSDPFMIPTVTHDTSSPVLPSHEEVARPGSLAEATRHRPPSSPIRCTTPSASTVSSPARSISMPQSPPKLRHPSRLHTRDLTSNTFRIYLKYYMNNAPPEQPTSPYTATSECDAYIKTRSLSYTSSSGDLTTPTKRPRHSYLHADDKTPRPYRQSSQSLDQTPHQLKCQESFAEKPASANTQGFTISYLRRVPELAEMARRVVKAETQRRMTEEQKNHTNVKANVKGSEVDSTRKRTGGGRVEHKNRNREPAGPKMKRLFQWAILQLYEEGSIILWDGPVRKHTKNRWCSGDVVSGNSSGLWKVNTSKESAAAPDDSVFSTISNVSTSSRRRNDTTTIEDEGALSDPNPNEEAYVPLTPALLAVEVEKAIGTIMSRPVEYSRSRPRGTCPRGPPPGPTKEDILKYLKRSDERWARVGEWAVDEALELLRMEDRAWSIGGGRWELCL